MGFALEANGVALQSGPGTARGARPRDGVTPLGDQLRAERERRGQALGQVSGATRIRESYLEALERHAWEALPADVFTRGYLRTYAQYLGLNEEHLLKAYARERRIAGADGPSPSGKSETDAARAFLERLARTQGVEARSGARWKWIALGGIGVGVAALVAWPSFHPLGSVRVVPTSMAVPPPAARPAVVAPPPTDVPDVPPTAEPVPAELSSAGSLKVDEFGVGTGVLHHRLVGRGNRFREGTTVWFWTSVLGGRPGDKVRHVWLHEGRSIAVVELDVRGAEWRTQSQRPLPAGSTGDWTVEARDPEGRVIATMDFACVAD